MCKQCLHSVLNHALVYIQNHIRLSMTIEKTHTFGFGGKKGVHSVSMFVDNAFVCAKFLFVLHGCEFLLHARAYTCIVSKLVNMVAFVTMNEFVYTFVYISIFHKSGKI